MVLIFDTLMNAVILLVFFRFLIQLAMVSPYNPVVLATFKSTKIIDILSRSIPNLAKGRVSLAALILLVVLCLLQNFGHMYLSGNPPYSATYLIIYTFLTMVQSVITICRYLIFASIILSYVVMFTQSRSAYIEVVQELVEPLLAPFRRLLPNMGMIDLSPICALMSLYVIEILMNEAARALLLGLS